MPENQDPVDVVILAKTLVEVGSFAIKCIEALKGWGRGKKIKEYTKEMERRISKINMLVGTLISYRLLNLHITQISDDNKDTRERYYLLKEQTLTPKKASQVLKREIDDIIDYYKQNLANFNTNTLDQSHASHIRDLIVRVGEALNTARVNLKNSNIGDFIEESIKLSRECCSLRGETYFAIDKLGGEFRRV